MSDVQFDWQRQERCGVAEAVLCEGKSPAQISEIIEQAKQQSVSLLLTRLSPEAAQVVISSIDYPLDFDEKSRTAILDCGLPEAVPSESLIVTAGSSDMPVALEAQRTLRFHGLDVAVIADCGVAGIWRLTEKLDRLRNAPVIIAVAGMEGALFPVLGGMVPGVVIAVPGSTGYGVASEGKTALNTALASCSPGVVTVNIDNGFGAAGAMLKILNVRNLR
jgi:NCAIR mutase (PurE)-related protein